MKNKAFTLAEILIALIIVAIVSGAVISSIKGVTENSNKSAFQKCYNHMTQTVMDMINDKMAYPDIPVSASDLTLQGFKNNYLEDGTTDTNKFYNQFKERTLGAIKTTTSKTDSKAFTAQDKSFWIITNSSNSSTTYKTIVFDVNGPDKMPNCPINLDSSLTAASTSCSDPDRFEFRIDNDGSIHSSNTNGYGGTTQYNFLKNKNYYGNPTN